MRCTRTASARPRGRAAPPRRPAAAALLLLLLAAGGAALERRAAPPPPAAVAHHHTKTRPLNATHTILTRVSLAKFDGTAVCADGSPGMYYSKMFTQPEDATLWLIYLPGLEFCYDAASCFNQKFWHPATTGSATWPKSQALSGLFSPEAAKNPFAGGNLVRAQRRTQHTCAAPRFPLFVARAPLPWLTRAPAPAPSLPPLSAAPGVRGLLQR
jgi:hypothetical protein